MPTMDRNNDARRSFLICALLAGATLTAFWPVIHHEFINFDDRGYILRNLHARAGLTWATVKWAFTSFYGANWHPLTWLSHSLDCQLYDLNPGGHHLTSLLLHAANTVLLFLVLQRLTAVGARAVPARSGNESKDAPGLVPES